MTAGDRNMASIMAEADRLGEQQAKIDERNRKRRAKGRKPLPDVSEMKDKEVLMKKYRTDDPTTIGSEDALKLFEMRKAAMAAEEDTDDLEDLEAAEDASASAAQAKGSKSGKAGKFRDPREVENEDKAIREAAAVRRVQDMKNGRIDHEGNWSPEGQKLDGGDDTVVVNKDSIREALQKAWGVSGEDMSGPYQTPAPAPAGESLVLNPNNPQPEQVELWLQNFKTDLYDRLRLSFEALESTLSDLQGRVAEIVMASAQSLPAPESVHGSDEPEDEFKALLSQKTPVSFDVGGTKMTFDAITVFHASPCITVVSKIGSAKITPKPGAQLLLSYSMDGVYYENDPVTYLGTRFDLPMFGLSFVGFIRDAEAGVIDADAGIPASNP